MMTQAKFIIEISVITHSDPMMPRTHRHLSNINCLMAIGMLLSALFASLVLLTATAKIK